MKKIYIAAGVIAVIAISIGLFQLAGKNKNPKILSEQNVNNQEPKTASEGGPDGVQGEPGVLEEANEEELARIYNDMSAQCEKGQWFDVEQVSGEKKTFSGRFSVDLPLEDEESASNEEADLQQTYYLDGDKEIASSKDEVLGFFEGREVEIQGVDEQGKIRPEKIRCAGRETNQDVLSFRQDVMNHVSKNISTLSPQEGQWEVYDIAWPADDHVYVDFAAVENADGDSADENVYSLLMQVSKQGSEVKTTQVAFLKMADEDSEEEWVTVSGDDKFKGLEDMDYYEYDEDLKKWVK